MAIARWVWVTPRESRFIIAEYTRARILVDGLPAATLDTARACKVLVSSTAARCVQSAQALSRDGTFLSDALFDESAGRPAFGLEIPETSPVGLVVCPGPGVARWAPRVHRVVFGSPGRASRAAQRLIELAQERGSVFLIGHAMMNLLIAKQLTAAGWLGRIRPLPDPWEFAVYQIQLEPGHVAPSSAA